VNGKPTTQAASSKVLVPVLKKTKSHKKKQLRFDDLEELRHQLETSEEEEEVDDGYPTRSKWRRLEAPSLPKLKKTSSTKNTPLKSSSTAPTKLKTTKQLKQSKAANVFKVPTVAIRPMKKLTAVKSNISTEVPRVKRKYTKRNKVEPPPPGEKRKVGRPRKYPLPVPPSSGPSQSSTQPPKRPYNKKKKLLAAPVKAPSTPSKLQPVVPRRPVGRPRKHDRPPTKEVGTKKAETKKVQAKKVATKRARELNDGESLVGGISLSSKSTLGSRKATKPAVLKKSDEVTNPQMNGISRKKKRTVESTPPPAKKLRLSHSPTRVKPLTHSTAETGKRKYKKRKK